MLTVVAAFSNVGEEQQKAAEEARENLKRLEVGLEGKRFFGGDNIGFADIAIGWLPYWIGIAEEVVAINLIDAESIPKLYSWFHAFIDIPIIKELMPPQHKLLHHTKAFLQARFDEALFLLRNLITEEGTPPLVLLEVLIESYRRCCSSIAAFDALVRACTQVGATEGAYDVIYNLRSRDCFIAIHAWNNFLNHLLQLNEIDRFWNLYRGMGSFGYMENVNTFNLVIYALCKECRLVEAISVLYKMMKGEIFPSVVSFNIIIDAACKISNLEEMLRKMVKIGIEPSVRTYATLIDGYARWGSLEEALRLCIEEASLLLADMIDKHICPDHYSYAILTKGLCRKGYLTEALKLHSQILEHNLIQDSFFHNILLNHICKRKNMAVAKQLLGSMITRGLAPDVYTYGTVIDGYCKLGNTNDALQVFDWMIKMDEKPNLTI
ncbi:hypothetical protein HN51_063555 [Arachis hypogaea]